MKTILESTLPAPKHIAEVEPRSTNDDALFAELAGVLKKHHALDRFGITLLHRHFDIAPGELLLENTDMLSRTHSITPVSSETLVGQKYIETAWRLGDDFVAMGCVCQDRDGSGHNHWPTR